jgi:predicted metal-dependent HD superfamily phosphohydrolase
MAARSLAAPLRRAFPALTRKLGAKTYRAATARGRFELDFVQASLDRSLRALKSDRIEVYLLHEVSRQDLTDELLVFLEKKRADGTLGAIGTATNKDDTAAIRREYAHVPEDAFRGGRSQVLKALLELPSIYRHAPLRAAWEETARANLAAELMTLG